MANFFTIDQDNWLRKSTFDFFKTFDLPFFNLTANVDVNHLKAHCERNGYSFFLASIFILMKAANEIPEFKMRLRGDEVIQFNNIRIGSTIQYEDHTFGFCYFPYEETLDEFNKVSKNILQEALSNKGFSPKDGDDDLLHLSVIPWVHFTSIKHARKIGQEDSIPKIMFGKYEKQGEALLMPINVEVHHALADGYHVGLFFKKMQVLLDTI